MFWLYAVEACTAAASLLMLCLLIAVACTAVVAYGSRALPSSPRDPCGRHPHVEYTLRNPEGVNCGENEVCQVPSP